MTEKEHLRKLWQWHEEAKAQEQALGMRNTTGLSDDERFELDLASRVALRKTTETWLAYQRAVEDYNP